jgi:hypothetical protein
MSPEVRADYARELGHLKADLVSLRDDIPNVEAVSRTLRCIDGTLTDIASLT